MVHMCPDLLCNSVATQLVTKIMYITIIVQTFALETLGNNWYNYCLE